MSSDSKRDMTTDRLDKVLQNVKCDKDAEEYVRKYTADGYKSFAEYFSNYMNVTGQEVSDVIAKSNVSKNYIYNIINGSRNPGRDKIIALCIGSGMNIREINRGLKIAEFGTLYAKDERDARIIIAVNKGIKNVIDINIILEKHGLEILE